MTQPTKLIAWLNPKDFKALIESLLPVSRVSDTETTDKGIDNICLFPKHGVVLICCLTLMKIKPK